MKTEPNVEAKLKAELDAIKKRQSELKKELDGIAKTLPRLSEEMANLDKDIAQMGLNGQARKKGILQRVRQTWRDSKAILISECVLILTLVAMLIALLVFRNLRLELLIFFGGVSVLLAVRTSQHEEKKYGSLVFLLILSFIPFAISIYTIDPTNRSNLTFLALGVLSVGLAMHSFSSEEASERQLTEINQKLTRLTDSAEQQARDVENKPQADK